MSAGALLELHAAAQHFLRRKTHADETARLRLRQAVFAVMRGGTRASTGAEALERLRLVLLQCQELGCNWSDVAALVNREWQEEALADGSL